MRFHRWMISLGPDGERNVAIVVGVLLILFMVWRFYG